VKLTVVVVSDRVFLDPSSDRIVRLVEKLARSEGFDLDYEYVPNDETLIRLAVLKASLRSDIVVVAGGTGPGPRDVSVDAVKPLLDKELEGFGEYFRRISVEQVGVRAALSRATAGVLGRSLVCVLPGSPRAVELALREVVLPIARLELQVIRGESHWEGLEVVVKSWIASRDLEVLARRSFTGPSRVVLVAACRAEGGVKVDVSEISRLVEEVEREHGVKISIMVSPTARAGSVAAALSVTGDDWRSCYKALGEILEKLNPPST